MEARIVPIQQREKCGLPADAGFNWRLAVTRPIMKAQGKHQEKPNNYTVLRQG